MAAPGQGVDGTLATYVVFSEVELVKFPDNLSWAEVGFSLSPLRRSILY
jgi:NADPH:quinone reductase-like Zn-dependent oxidoreductase